MILSILDFLFFFRKNFFLRIERGFIQQIYKQSKPLQKTITVRNRGLQRHYSAEVWTINNRLSLSENGGFYIQMVFYDSFHLDFLFLEKIFLRIERGFIQQIYKQSKPLQKTITVRNRGLQRHYSAEVWTINNRLSLSENGGFYIQMVIVFYDSLFLHVYNTLYTCKNLRLVEPNDKKQS